MKSTLSGRRHTAAGRRNKRRPARRTHAARRHKKTAAEAADVAVVTPVIVEEALTVESESPFFGVEPDKRDEELSDEEALDREERQELY